MRLTVLLMLLFTATFAQAETRGLIAMLPLTETGGLKLTQDKRDLLEEAVRALENGVLKARLS